MKTKNEAQAVGLAEIYRFLAQTMRYPESGWMREDFFLNFFQIAEKIPDGPDIKRCRDQIRVEKKWLETLQAEYTRLFINAFPIVVAPPYGSAYVNEGEMKRGMLDDIAGFYHQKGFQLQKTKEQPDWLVHELEFIAILSRGDHEGMEQFLSRYFRTWFPTFRERVAQKTIHPYFDIATHMIDFFTA